MSECNFKIFGVLEKVTFKYILSNVATFYSFLYSSQLII